VKRFLASDITKLGLYFVAAFVMAAVLTPWLYNAGAFMAELAQRGTANEVVDWIGNHARRADYADYFKRSLLLSGLLLLVPLLLAMRMRSDPPPLRESPWSVYLPRRAVAARGGQRLRNPRSGLLQLLTGILLAGGLLFAMGFLLVTFGWFTFDEPLPWQAAVGKALGPSIAVSLVEEIIFRGILLGICLRAFRPATAIVVISLLFAGLHFLQPTGNLVPEDRGSNTAGFEMLLLIARRFQDFHLVFHEFISLTVVGLILAYARYATASLWLPIGLHSGWIFAYSFFDRVADRRPDLDPALALYIGEDLKAGLIPLGTLAVTAFLVVLFARLVRQPPSFPGQHEPLAGQTA